MPAARQYLFVKGELRGFLENRKREASIEIQSQDVNYILNVSVSGFCNYLLQKYALPPPVLEEAKITVDQEEKNVDVSHYPNRLIIFENRPSHVKGTEITYYVPFEGNSELFKYKPSTFTFNPPSGVVINQELCLSFECIDHDTESLKKNFQRELSEIRRWLAYISNDVKQFNESLPNEIEKQVKERREKLLKDRGLVAELGFSLRKREDAVTTFAVSAIKRKIIPQPKASIDSYKPEPTLSMDDYEHILSVTNNMALVMERSPRAFQTMKEEDIRQHFLVQLNGQYEGQATGETFNYEGKTDILIRNEGKNIFIAECKFWNGAQALKETIDQILNYLSWRDSKTAILLFNRSKNLSNVLSQIPDIVREHPKFGRQVEYKSESSFRFILHHKDDDSRELYLSVLVFEVPS
jgi:hypothetical protein